MSRHFVFPQRRLTQVTSALVAALLIGSVSYLGIRFYNSSHAATPGTLYVSPSSDTWTSGSTVSVTIREESGTTGVNSVQFFLNYNSSQLQFVSTANGDFTAAAKDTTSNPGVVQVFRGSNSDLTGDHAVATVNFKVMATSGSTALSFDEANSFIVGNGNNILNSTQGGTFTVSGGSAVVTQDANLGLIPASSTLTPGTNVTMTVKVNSPTQGAYVVEPILSYPSDKLQYVSYQDSTTFPTATRSTTGTAGTLDFIRGVAGGDPGFVGTADVIKVTFKVIGTNGTSAAVTFNSGSLVLNGGGKSILATTTGGDYAISSGSTPPPPTPSPTPTQSPTPSPTPSLTSSTTSSGAAVVYKSAVTYTPLSGGTASLDGNNTQVQGTINLTPSAASKNSDDTIVKVEYIIGKKAVVTLTKEPFSYKLDTKKLKNGTYEITIKTTYESGAADTSKDTVIVKNPVTLSYVLAHYAGAVAGSAAGLVLIAFFIWKFIWPRFGGGSGYDGYGTDYNYDAYIGGGDDGLPTAPDPAVITPAGAEPKALEVTPEQASAAQSTEAIAIRSAAPQPVTSKSAKPGPAQPPQIIKPASDPQISNGAPGAQITPDSTHKF